MNERAAKWVVKLVGAFCVLVLVMYALKHYGTQYTRDKINEQLNQTGLSPFVHFENVHFNPLTFTPSLENVQLGQKDRPWLTLARITFHQYPFIQPDLDVDFWIAQSSAEHLAIESQIVMQTLGIDTLLGKGSWQSHTGQNGVTQSEFYLDIKDAGKLNLKSKWLYQAPTASLQTLRTDLLASLALGQPEAMLLLYGDSLLLEQANLNYQDAGSLKHMIPSEIHQQMSDDELLFLLRHLAASTGLATVPSHEAKEISEKVLPFIRQLDQLTINLTPKQTMSVKELSLSFYEQSLYKDSSMSIEN
ncbi:hypothetical protein [Marinomonas epiphytica]